MAYADATTGGRVIDQGWGKVDVTLSSACEVGDLLGKSASTWVRADMNSTIVVFAELVAGQKGASGDVITAYRMAVVSGVTGATTAAPIYAADAVGETVESPGTNYQLVGYAIDSTHIFLSPDGAKLRVLPPGAKFETVSEAKTLDIGDSGVWQLVNTDAIAITLPATVVGYTYKIMNVGNDATVLVTVSPNASDKIAGNGFTAADDKDALNTKATAKFGDYIVLLGDGANGWFFQEVVGTWAREG